MQTRLLAVAQAHRQEAVRDAGKVAVCFAVDSAMDTSQEKVNEWKGPREIDNRRRGTADCRRDFSEDAKSRSHNA
jgi:hypothetical protein